MTRPVIFVINGPRRVGKDTAAEAMATFAARLGHRWQVVPLARRMKLETLAVYGIPADQLDLYETLKDEPMPAFGLLQTFRNAIINHSHERQAVAGPNVWVDAWTADVRALFDLGMADAVIMSDGRFLLEVMTALAITPAVLLYRVYRTPKLHHDKGAWDGDIGSWLFPELFDVPQVSLINDRTIDDLRYEAWEIGHHFYRSVQRASASV